MNSLFINLSSSTYQLIATDVTSFIHTLAEEKRCVCRKLHRNAYTYLHVFSHAWLAACLHNGQIARPVISMT